jgi:hypothetical protein
VSVKICTTIKITKIKINKKCRNISSEFFVPGQYPPQKYTPNNFAENARQGSWKNSAPLVLQLDKTKSVILLSDNLVNYADRPNSSIERRDGGILAEVNTGIWGTVSDATYDFDLCYNVLHDARKLPADEFVTRLRRWLHEQQYSEIPDMLRLRHVESHDSLRAQLWYGTEPHRSMVALTAFIHGIPLVYHEQEIGHFNSFQQIFEIRKVLPELNGGDADYLAVDAPPGVFAVLRTKGDDATIAVINFNGTKIPNTVLKLARDKLPENLRSKNQLEYFNVYDCEAKSKRVGKTWG